MATAHTEAAPVAMPTTGQARSRLDVTLLVVAASGAVIAGATAFGAGGRAWDVALAITIASGGLYAVRRWGLPALLLIPLLLGPLWPGSVASGVGDEPHYLVIAESVVSDHDLAVANNYQKPPFSQLVQKDIHLGWDQAAETRSEYSVHQPGLGVLVAPGWWVAGRRGAVAVVALAAALLLWEMVLLAEAFGADRRLAVTATALLYLAPAVFIYGQIVFTEILVALALTHLARVARLAGRTAPAMGTARGDRVLLATGALAAAALPWIHLRYVLSAVVLVIALGWRGRRAIAWLPAAALAISGGLVLVAFDAWFGSASPSAAYGPAIAGYEHTGLPTLRGAVGLLVDGHVGLVFAAPIVLLALAAVPVVARIDRTWTYAAGGAAAAYFAVGSGFSAWWLATSPPGRNWTPLLPLAVPFLACMLKRLTAVARVMVLTVAIAIALLFAAFPLSIYPDGPGVTTIWERLHIDRVMPTLRPVLGRTPVGVGLLLVSIIGACVLAAAMRVRRQSMRANLQSVTSTP